MPVMYYKTPVGIAKIVDDEGFISRVHILDEELEPSEPSSPLLQEAAKQFDEYFAGKRKEFDLPLNQSGSQFQQLVWQELLKIDYGKTITYNEQSKRMNHPLAIRAIAAANGKNNLWVIVPCHRVIGSNGSLTGYAGGLWRKQWLLAHETKIAGEGQTMLDF